ncbi:hypothetical protein Ancab_026996 [Ancistrocladus abbreviatus]
MNLNFGNTLVRRQRMSSTDVVRQNFTNQGELYPPAIDVKRLEFNVKQLGMDWLKGSFVGRVHDVEVISILQQRERDVSSLMRSGKQATGWEGRAVQKSGLKSGTRLGFIEVDLVGAHVQGSVPHKSDNLNIVLSKLKEKRSARPNDQLSFGLGLKHKIRSSRRGLIFNQRGT